jgi:AraC-like DNA-binding protein
VRLRKITSAARFVSRYHRPRQIKAYIDDHLGDLALGPTSIARAHYISTRYLHKLFAGERLTVSDWVRRRRLEACRRDLRDPALAHETISAVARADDIELVATGGTSLRYDTTGGQFIYNWQTPKKAGSCYLVTVSMIDGSSLSAHFKLK